MEENEKNLKEFWKLYDAYILISKKREVDAKEIEEMRGGLSYLLAKLEKPERFTQLLRPEKNWNRVIAWQVLRNRNIVYCGKSGEHYLNFLPGEILAWIPHWDRDVFVTRIPMEEKVSGHFLRPGRHVDVDSQAALGLDDYDWERLCQFSGLGDERGLYLPLFEKKTVVQLCSRFFEDKKQKMLKYLEDGDYGSTYRT